MSEGEKEGWREQDGEHQRNGDSERKREKEKERERQSRGAIYRVSVPVYPSTVRRSFSQRLLFRHF